MAMSVKNILFDLDGTLLPMDQEAFVDAYTKRLARYMVPYGYDPELLIRALWAGTGAMMKNDGIRTNETVFWEVFSGIAGKDARADLAVFERFYLTDFQQVRNICGFAPKAAETVRRLRERGLRVILATNPLFPAVATESRIRWAGLTPEDAEECAMVGNDTGEDMVAENLGMQTFLLTDCLINRTDALLSAQQQRREKPSRTRNA